MAWRMIRLRIVSVIGIISMIAQSAGVSGPATSLAAYGTIKHDRRVASKSLEIELLDDFGQRFIRFAAIRAE